ncbi:MAG: VOC family protein [bacterium]|nr:VOC family protein [bacterium]
MLTSFNHTGIVVQDIDAMVEFYTGKLGLRVTDRYETDAGDRRDHTGISGARRVLVFLQLGDGGHMLELVHYLEPAASDGHLDKHQLGAGHICWLVDDLRAVHERLSADGVPFVTDPVFSRTDDGSEWGVVYFQDPEGNWLELIEA